MVVALAVAVAAAAQAQHNGEAFSSTPTVERERYDTRVFMAPLMLTEARVLEARHQRRALIHFVANVRLAAGLHDLLAERRPG